MNNWQRWKNIMKCVPFEEKRLAKWQPPYIVQPKYDGVRCRAVPSLTNVNSGYLLVSSEENILFSVPHINAAFDTFKFKAEFDGELYCHGKSFEEIVSVTSRTTHLHPNANEIQFHAFDIVNELPQMKRTILLENLRGIHPLIKVAPFWICSDLDEVTRTFDRIIELGYEGIIVRHFEAPYERKRSTWVMKFKPKKQDRYTIVGYNEEISKDGIPKGRLGSLEMSSQKGERFSVSAGLSDEEKQRFWDIKDLLIGLDAIVHYQHLTDRKVPKGSFDIEILFKLPKEEQDGKAEV